MNNELQYHKISNVNTYKVRSHFPRLVGKNAFRNEHAYGDEFVVKEIITDQGPRMGPVIRTVLPSGSGNR